MVSIWKSEERRHHHAHKKGTNPVSIPCQASRPPGKSQTAEACRESYFLFLYYHCVSLCLFFVQLERLRVELGSGRINRNRKDQRKCSSRFWRSCTITHGSQYSLNEQLFAFWTLTLSPLKNQRIQCCFQWSCCIHICVISKANLLLRITEHGDWTGII